jgi:hypothetical protein
LICHHFSLLAMLGGLLFVSDLFLLLQKHPCCRRIPRILGGPCGLLKVAGQRRRLLRLY